MIRAYHTSGLQAEGVVRWRMDSRVSDRLLLTFTGVLLAGCDRQADAQECGHDVGESLPGPPTLVAARMESDLIVRLTFSEPLASIAGVNPASFRISWASYSAGYPGYVGYTAYYDPTLAFCLGSDYCPNEYTDVVELDCAEDDPAALLLRLDTFSHYICELFNDVGGPTSLFPHFDDDLATITDLDGEPLASIAAHFVTAPDGYAIVDGDFPNYPMRIPIDCPP
jgi:hypothetical protein